MDIQYRRHLRIIAWCTYIYRKPIDKPQITSQQSVSSCVSGWFARFWYWAGLITEAIFSRPYLYNWVENSVMTPVLAKCNVVMYEVLCRCRETLSFSIKHGREQEKTEYCCWWLKFNIWKYKSPKQRVNTAHPLYWSLRQDPGGVSIVSSLVMTDAQLAGEMRIFISTVQNQIYSTRPQPM